MGIQVGIAGVSGYTGIELVRLISAHPNAEISMVSADRAAGQSLSQVWPGLTGLCDLPVEPLDVDAMAERCDVVFLALPHGVSARAAGEPADQASRRREPASH